MQKQSLHSLVFLYCAIEFFNVAGTL